jgi:predicted DNA binding CopG/RHH family protein
MKKTIPTIRTDETAERFIDTADLSKYDLSGRFVQFELKPWDKTVSLRLPESRLEAVRQDALSTVHSPGGRTRAVLESK